MGRVLRRLILAEKFSAARRLAQILSEGMAEKVRADVSSYFTFSSGGDDVIVFPLRGHIVEIDYPESAQDWVGTDLDTLVDLEPIRQESPPALHDALRGLADSVDEVVLATDYDREGELIGVEALETLRRQHPDLPARRARFSAMTTSEVRRAFENLVEPDWALADAAAARQRIDLAWGAVLTRFLTVECGSDRQVLSAGRVQTPTLRLAADRERDRQDFVPRPFGTSCSSQASRRSKRPRSADPSGTKAAPGHSWRWPDSGTPPSSSESSGEITASRRRRRSTRLRFWPKPPALGTVHLGRWPQPRSCTSEARSAILGRTTPSIRLRCPSARSSTD